MKTLFISCLAALLAFGNIGDVSASIPKTTKVSDNDTTAGYLNGKLVAGSGVAFTENNDAGDESMTIATANIPSSGINWDSLSGVINSAGINWSNINSLAPIQSGGVNWNDINSAELQTAGINWSSLSGNINSSGVNWYETTHLLFLQYMNLCHSYAFHMVFLICIVCYRWGTYIPLGIPRTGSLCSQFLLFF